MPTRKKTTWAKFDFVGLLSPRRFSRAALKAVADTEAPKYRHGGLDVQQRFERIFDPDLTDLSDLKIGFFDKKALTLPSSRIPVSKPDLLRLCRQMVDRGENALHLRLMLQNFPGGWTLRQHATALWELRQNSVELFLDVVRGFHGQAISRYNEAPPEGLSLHDFKGLLARQGVLWCAMDAQMAIGGARVATIKPLGSFLAGTMKELKGGTAIRLMRGALHLLEVNIGKFQTLEEVKRDGRKRQKAEGKEAKDIGHQAGKRITARHALRPFHFGGARFFRRKLDEAVAFIRSQIGPLRRRIDFLETYNVGNGSEPKRTNRHRTFHQIWYSDLTATVGAAVALMRFAMAEAEIEALVDEAFGDSGDAGPTRISALSPPPAGLDRHSPMFKRVLDLLDSARRAQLRDSNNDSRTPHKPAPDEERDPEDFAGLTVVEAAYEFLLTVSQRHRHAYDPRRVNDGRQQTYWHLDMVPDVRLNLMRDPTPRFLG